MANLVVNQWLQDAVEKACENHVKELYLPDAIAAGDDHIYVTTSVADYGLGINVQASWGMYPKETETRTEFFTPQQAIKIFLEQKDE